MKRIYTKRGEEILVCDCHYDLVKDKPWHLNSYGYAGSAQYLGRKNGKTKNSYILMHRLIMGFPRGQVDHADTVKTHNWCGNLRIATHSDNQINRNPPKHNTTGYAGVSWHSQHKKYRAGIGIDGQKIHLGYWSTPEAAAFVYNVGALLFHGEFARLNKIKDPSPETEEGPLFNQGR